MAFIAIWACNKSKTWESRGFTRRIAAFRNAVNLAAAEAINIVGRRQTWIFAAPEYAFSNMHGGEKKAAEQVSTTLEGQFLNAALALSGTHQLMVCAPGTIPVVEGMRGGRWARNTSYGFFNGGQAWRLDKRRGVGEVAPGSGVTFRPGQGYATKTIDGISYGIEICADACNAGTLAIQVDRHLILASGADLEHTHDMSTEMRIVADSFAFGVEQAGMPVDSYGKDTTDNTEIYYYEA